MKGYLALAGAIGLGFLMLVGAPAMAQSLRGGAGPAAGAEAGTGLPVPELAKPLMIRLTQAQREVNATLSREMRAVRQGSSSAALAVAGVAFLYGILHAAGPGHGKLIVSAFFLARDTRLVTGLLAGVLFSLLQAASSIALVAVLALALEWGGFEVLGQSVRLELVSYALIVVIGLYLTVSAVWGHEHDHGGERATPRPGRRPSSLWGVVTAAGLTPCASAIILLLFAWANHVFALGIGATLVMALGMAITVCAMGLAAIGARRAVLGSTRARPRLFHWAERGLSVTGAILITVFGCLLCAGAWARLP